MIVYIGRDYGNKLEFPVQWTDELLRDTMKDITDEVEAWQVWEAQKVLPAELPMEKDKRGKETANWQCRYCAFANHCPDRKQYSKYTKEETSRVA